MNIFRKIKWFIQRGIRGWADCDVWSFDSYLNKIIISGLKRLKENHQGCPSDLWDEYAVNQECHKWYFIIDEMIQGFEAADTIVNGHCMYFSEIDNGMMEYRLDKEQLENLSKKYKRGMKLFSEYYLNLWD